jgi:hypothetical protein
MRRFVVLGILISTFGCSGDLSINGATIEQLVKDPRLLAEIELLRTASNCR